MMQINLLPWREQLRQEKAVLFGLQLGLGIVGVLVLVIVINIFIYGLISHQESRNKFLEVELGNENVRLITLNKRTKELTAITEELDFILALKESSYQAVRQLNELAKVVPDAVSLSKIARAGSLVTLTGNAKSNLQITLLMKNIAASKVFTQPNLTEINVTEQDKNDERKFMLTMETRNQVTQ